MRCPYCKSRSDKVTDSRSCDGGASIRRRRVCKTCGRRFTTRERPEEDAIRVIKSNGLRETFERAKIRAGIMKACWKRKISDEEITAAVARVEQRVLEKHDREVPTAVIGELVMDELRKLDKVAYVRFASVYRDFEDVTDFMGVLQELVKGARGGARGIEGAETGPQA